MAASDQDNAADAKNVRLISPVRLIKGNDVTETSVCDVYATGSRRNCLVGLVGLEDWVIFHSIFSGRICSFGPSPNLCLSVCPPLLGSFRYDSRTRPPSALVLLGLQYVSSGYRYWDVLAPLLYIGSYSACLFPRSSAHYQSLCCYSCLEEKTY